MTDDKLADEISRQLFARDDDSVSLNENQWQQIIAALRRPESDPSFRVFKLCPEHQDVAQWTVHPTGYAIPAIEVCPVCEEIAYNQRLAAAEAEEKR